MLERVVELFPGVYDNSSQLEAERAAGTPAVLLHSPLTARVTRLVSTKFSDCTFFVQGYADPNELPYMCRVYEFAQIETAATLKVYYFDEQRTLFSAAPEASRLAELRRSGGEYHPGCDLVVSLDAQWVCCVTEGDQCRKCINGIDGAVEYLALRFNGECLLIKRKSTGPDGSVLAGRADDIPYQLKRVI
ncbi:MAG: hypothetical protein ACI87W_001160 [Halieaceae bacterium]|jgi:hypothetical protein